MGLHWNGVKARLIRAVFLLVFLGAFGHAAAQSCLLDTQWETPAPTLIDYAFGSGWIAGVPDPVNSVLPTDPKGMYERYFSPNPGVAGVESVVVGLGLLDDADDDLTFQVVVYDDDGSGQPGAFLGGGMGGSPTTLGVPAAGHATFEFLLPSVIVPTTAQFHVGVEIFPGDATDVMVVSTSCIGPPNCATAQGENDGSNHIFTTGFAYENLQTVYGADFDFKIIPRLQGPDPAFDYARAIYYLDELSDPVPVISGTPGGSFSATPVGLVINPTTGEVDLSVSAVGDYTVTYTVSTPGLCANQDSRALRIEDPATIGDRVWNDLDGDGVQDGGEPALPGVLLFLDANSNGVLDGGETTAVSDGTGAYQFISLSAGAYSVAVDATTVPFGFVLTTGNDPSAVVLATGEDRTDVDFGYQQQDASIGDFVWNDLNGNGLQDGGEPGLAGVRVFLDANLNGAFDAGELNDISDAVGAYDLINLATGNYSVKLDATTLPGGFVLTTSDPVAVMLAAGEDFNGADFGLQQPVDIAINDVSQSEGNSGTSAMNFDVTLSASFVGTVTVDYALVPGSASAGSDYVDASGTVTFNPGVTSQTIAVDVLGDDVFESDETFSVVLSNPGNAQLADDTGVGTIQNDDAQPGVSIADVTMAEGNSGNSTWAFSVTLSNASSSDVTVSFQTASGSATAGEDFIATSGDLTVAAGALNGAVNVDVIGDLMIEGDETFDVNLSSPVNATLSDAQAVGTIVNDDAGADLMVTMTASPENLLYGETLTYSVQVTNLGPEVALSTVLTVDLAAGLDFIQASDPGCTHVNGVVTCDLGDLSLNQVVNVTLDVAANTTGTVYTQASVASPVSDDPQSANNASVRGVIIGALTVPGLSLLGVLALIALMGWVAHRQRAMST